MASYVDFIGQEDGVQHCLQVAFVTAPTAALQVPAGHAVGFKEEKGQYEPVGQMTGALVLQ